MLSKILVLVMLLVAITAASQSSSSDTNRNENCEALLTQCERITHELRKERVRAEAACYKLKFQLWRLNMQHTKLEDDVGILRSQLEQPLNSRRLGESRRNVPDFLPRPRSMEGFDGTNPNCTVRLDFCEWSQNSQRQIRTSISADIANCRARIEEQTRANNELIATKASLKSQLTARGDRYHWVGNENLDNPSSAEYSIDDAEIERRVAESVVTPAPQQSH